MSDAGEERQLLAEDARVLAFAGPPDAAEWLPDEEVERLLDARPDANVGPDQARAFVRAVVEGWDQLAGDLDEAASRLAEDLLGAHRRVRDAARRKGVRFEVRPHLPSDALGVYVLLPAGAA